MRLIFKNIIKGFFLLSLTAGYSFTCHGVEPDTVFNGYFRQDIGGWIAADATFSVALPDGKTLWLFGDTFIGEVNADNSIVQGAKFIRNSAVLQDGDNFSTLFMGTRESPETFIQTAHPDSTWYWPEHGIVQDDTLYVFLSKFRKSNGPDGFNFEFIGNDIALFAYPELNSIRIINIPFYESNGVIYGDRILRDSSFIYIYGRKEDDSGYNIPYPHVARTQSGQITGKWEFYNGSGWSDDPLQSVRINNFQVSQQFAVVKHADKYILLTQDIWFSPDIWTFTADTPVGPWKNKTLVYTTPYPFDNMFTYNAWAHSQFDNESALLVSYNSNGNFADIFNNVELYRPRFIRIPFSEIDPEFGTNTDINTEFTGKKHPENLTKSFPNPCSDIVTISYMLEKASFVDVEIIDIYGKSQGTYVNRNQPAGHHQVQIPVSAWRDGIYFYRINGTEKSETGRIIKFSGSQ